ncbi:hypothetical protein M405DRAFT_861558 [Rhizopogon salebrosus TDB-379]|nr:hypothetical protein M405DRAFT_861558 [Rhizopogon salebrosus TDB-379]
MSNDLLFLHLMHGVNIAASAAFWQNAPPTPSDVREAAALSLQPSRSRTPRPRVGSSITPTTLRPSVLVCSYGPPSGGQEWQVELEKKYPDSPLSKFFDVRYAL